MLFLGSFLIYILDSLCVCMFLPGCSLAPHPPPPKPPSRLAPRFQVQLEAGPFRRAPKAFFSSNPLLTKMYNQGPSKDLYEQNALSLWGRNSWYTYQHKCPFALCNKKCGSSWSWTHYFFHLLHIFSNLSTAILPFFNMQNIGIKTKAKW